MTLQEARSILDAARDGKPIEERLISMALHVTGDLGFWWPKPKEYPA